MRMDGDGGGWMMMEADGRLMEGGGCGWEVDARWMEGGRRLVDVDGGGWMWAEVGGCAWILTDVDTTLQGLRDGTGKSWAPVERSGRR